MRFNKLELTSLAAQPPHKFEKEGVLFIREKQEGFFRKTEKPGSKPKKFGCYGSGFGRVSVERWCRLRGNLLFYFKSRDHWSEPAGVIVVEGCQVIGDNNPKESTFGILLVFGGGHQLQLATYTEDERDAWVIALRSASHNQMRQQMETLQNKLKAKLLSLGLNGEAEALGDTNLAENSIDTVVDFDDVPLLETWVSCDNLLCDALGRAPSARLTLTFRNNSSLPYWRYLGQTEIAEKSSNPVFFRTFLMFEKLGFNDDTEVKISAYDTRDRFTATRTLLGSATILMKEMKEIGRTRLKLNSPNPDGRTAGFVTLTTKSFESKIPGSTDSTPVHKSNLNGSHAVGAQENGRDLMDKMSMQSSHRRSQSLPPSSTKGNVKFPKISDLAVIFENPVLKTYRFHSGLGGDIIVQEVMSESRLSFSFPQQLLSLWICEEKELVHEMAALGELKAPWHDCQMSWLENHLNIINTYSHALENLDQYEGPSYRKSINKDDRTYEFVPTNLHFQRICVENDSLRKSGAYDVVTHGAFTSMGMKSPGLIKMLKDLKAPQKDSTAWCSESDRLQMTEDTLGAVRRVRKEVVDCMRLLMKLARDRKRDGMISIVEDMLRKTKCLCSLLDLTMIEEVFAFLEENRVNIRPEKDEFSESVAEFMQRNKLKIDLALVRPNKIDTLQTPCAEFLSKELRTPDVDNIFSPQALDGDYWRTYSAYTSGYQSVDRLSDIDEFEENFRYLSVVDKTKHYYTLCKAASPFDTPVGSPKLTPKKSDFDENVKTEDEQNVKLDSGWPNDEGIGDDKIQIVVGENSDENDDGDLSDEDSDEEEKVSRKKDKDSPKDQGLVSESAAGLYYKAGDEPEPIDLTHLNIEAAMMCLASKVRYLSGKADSPTLSSRTFRFKELDLARKSRNGLHTVGEPSKEPSTFQNFPGPQTKETDALQDWASELRPSMRKLRQGMDSLCKTARLSCSVLRLQQQSEAVTLSHAVRHRRDVCFSQALTTLISGLMARLWCVQPDPHFLSICFSLGPLVSFESLLSLYGEDVAIFNDMIVAVEDLRNVEFSLIMVDKRTKLNVQPKTSTTSTPESKDGKLNILEYHTFPLPRVTGSRSSLKVMLPVPGYVYTMLPVEQIKSAKFSVTPVLFNIGINQNATLAAKLGYNGPQEKNNLDNFKILSEYHRRLKKLSLPPQQCGSRSSKRFSTYQNEPDIEDLLTILKSEVNNKKNKNVEVLHLVCNITRRLNGLRFTSCKSGKDRTGMSATLEQVQILSQEYDLDENEYQKALDVMRSEGTRRSNTEKNVGKRLYAFNSLQLTTFPYQYRPPVGSYGNVET